MMSNLNPLHRVAPWSACATAGSAMLRVACASLWLSWAGASLAQTASPALVTPIDRPGAAVPAPALAAPPVRAAAPDATTPAAAPAAATPGTTGRRAAPVAEAEAAPPPQPRRPRSSKAKPRGEATPARPAPERRSAERCVSAPDREPYAQRADVQAWAAQVAAQFPELDAPTIVRQIGQACYQADVARLIMPTPTGQTRNWAAYRARFVEPQRIRAGLDFWSANRRWLAAAEARYGVPAQVIVGIIGVETLYGRQVGTFRVLDALSTLSFDFPSGRSDRSNYFREQLAALLRLASKEGLEPSDIRGSYAGAIGWAQFMPGSWLSFAVDFNGDSRIDLRDSVPDVIGSVANFLSAHGWQSGLPARYGVRPPEDADQLAALLAPDIRPSFTHHELEDAGAVLDEAGREHSGLLALVELQNGADQPPSYVAGSENFWALTRYNWSAYYAMAVLDLGEAVAAQRGRGADLASDLDQDKPAPRVRAKSKAKAKPMGKATAGSRN
jgi:membrane-bound lytic murein transglycosylase B